MNQYFYRDAVVRIPLGAEISEAFHPNDGLFRDLIQTILDGVKPWEYGEDPYEIFDLPYRVGARVVALTDDETPVGAVNPHHKARNPGLSPFIRVARHDLRGSTDDATLELTGTVERPVLTRVYPGDYMPPLPWMRTARKAPGGREQCLEFWKTHAFILRRSVEITEVHPAPDWYAQS